MSEPYSQYPEFDKRRPIKRNYHKVDTLVTDTDPDSKYFKIIESPDVIPIGKSSILIEGTEFLKNDTNVVVELLDADKKPIFTAPIPDVLEGSARRIMIETNHRTAHGDATLTILGELDPARYESFIPMKYRGYYNVKWQKTFQVDLQSFNNEPILFYDQSRFGPEMNVTEKLIPHLVPSGSVHAAKVSRTTGLISGRRVPQNVRQPIDPTEIRGIQAIISLVEYHDGQYFRGYNPQNSIGGRIYNRFYPLYFTAEKSRGRIATYHWDFGDPQEQSVRYIGNNGTNIWSNGNTSDKKKVGHIYRKAGAYTVTLTTTGLLGDVSQDTFAVVILPPLAPIANYSTNPKFPELGNDPNVTFTNLSENVLNNSKDEGYGVDTEYEWNFGDGIKSNSADATISHTYSNLQTYNPGLTVYNNWGEQWDTKGAEGGGGNQINPTGLNADFYTATPAVGTTDSISLINDSTAGSTATYSWWFKDSAGNNYTPNFPSGSPYSANDEDTVVQFDDEDAYTVYMEVTEGASDDLEVKEGYLQIGSATTTVTPNGGPDVTYGTRPLTVTYNLTSIPDGQSTYFSIKFKSNGGIHHTGADISNWLDESTFLAQGNVSAFNWSGDPDWFKVTATGGNASFDVTYNKADTYWVTVYAYDSNGKGNFKNLQTVRINNQVPSNINLSMATQKENRKVGFPLSMNLTYNVDSSVPANGVSIYWEVTSTNRVRVNSLNDPLVSNWTTYPNSTSNASTTIFAEAPGNYAFRAVVRDHTGAAKGSAYLIDIQVLDNQQQANVQIL